MHRAFQVNRQSFVKVDFFQNSNNRHTFTFRKNILYTKENIQLIHFHFKISESSTIYITWHCDIRVDARTIQEFLNFYFPAIQDLVTKALNPKSNFNNYNQMAVWQTQRIFLTVHKDYINPLFYDLFFGKYQTNWQFSLLKPYVSQSSEFNFHEPLQYDTNNLPNDQLNQNAEELPSISDLFKTINKFLKTNFNTPLKIRYKSFSKYHRCSECRKQLENLLEPSYFCCTCGYFLCENCSQKRENKNDEKLNEELFKRKKSCQHEFLEYFKLDDILKQISENNRNPSIESLQKLISTLAYFPIETLQFIASYLSDYFNNDGIYNYIVKEIQLPCNQFKSLLITICSFKEQTFSKSRTIDFSNTNFINLYKSCWEKIVVQNSPIDKKLINLILSDQMSKLNQYAIIDHTQFCLDLFRQEKVSFKKFPIVDFADYIKRFNEMFLYRNEYNGISLNIDLDKIDMSFCELLLYTFVIPINYHNNNPMHFYNLFKDCLIKVFDSLEDFLETFNEILFLF